MTPHSTANDAYRRMHCVCESSLVSISLFLLTLLTLSTTLPVLVTSIDFIQLQGGSQNCQGAIARDGAVFVPSLNVSYYACNPTAPNPSYNAMALASVTTAGTWTSLVTATDCPGPGAGVVIYTEGTNPAYVVASCGGTITNAGSLIAIDPKIPGTIIKMAANACTNIVSMAEDTSTGAIYFACGGGTNSAAVMVLSSIQSSASASQVLSTSDCPTPKHLVYNSVGKYVYVVCGSNKVVQVSTQTYAQIVRVFPTMPLRVAVHYSSGNIFVATQTSVYASTAPSTAAVVEIINQKNCTAPQDVWVDQASNLLYVQCNSDPKGTYGVVRSLSNWPNDIPGGALRIANHREANCRIPMARSYANWYASGSDSPFSYVCPTGNELIHTGVPLFSIVNLPTTIFYGAGMSTFTVKMSSNYAGIQSISVFLQVSGDWEFSPQQLGLSAGGSTTVALLPRATGTNAYPPAPVTGSLTYVNNSPSPQAGVYYQMRNQIFLAIQPRSRSYVTGIPLFIYPNQLISAMWIGENYALREVGWSLTMTMASGTAVLDGTTPKTTLSWNIPYGTSQLPIAWTMPSTLPIGNNSFVFGLDYDSQYMLNSTKIMIGAQGTLTPSTSTTTMATNHISFPIMLTPSAPPTSSIDIAVSFACDNPALSPSPINVTIPSQTVATPISFTFTATTAPTSCVLKFGLPTNAASYQWSAITFLPSIAFVDVSLLTVTGIPTKLNQLDTCSSIIITPSAAIDEDFDLTVSFSLAGVTNAPTPIHFTAGSAAPHSFTFTAPSVSTPTVLTIIYSRTAHVGNPTSLNFLAPNPSTLTITLPATVFVSATPALLWAAQPANLSIAVSEAVDVDFSLDATFMFMEGGGAITTVTTGLPIIFTAGSALNHTFSFLAPSIPDALNRTLVVTFIRTPSSTSPYSSFQTPSPVQIKVRPQGTIVVQGAPSFLFPGQSATISLVPSTTIQYQFNVNPICTGLWCSTITPSYLQFGPTYLINSFTFTAPSTYSVTRTDYANFTFSKQNEPQFTAIAPISIMIRRRDTMTLSGIGATVYTNTGAHILTITPSMPVVYPVSVQVSFSGTTATPQPVNVLVVFSPSNNIEPYSFALSNFDSAGYLSISLNLNTSIQFATPSSVYSNVFLQSLVQLSGFPSIVYAGETSPSINVYLATSPATPTRLTMTVTGITTGVIAPSNIFDWTIGSYTQYSFTYQPPAGITGNATFSFDLVTDGQYSPPANRDIQVLIQPFFTVTGVPDSLVIGQIGTITLTPSVAPSEDIHITISTSSSIGTSVLSTGSLLFHANLIDDVSFTITPTSSGTIHLSFTSTNAISFLLPGMISITATTVSTSSSTGSVDASSTGQVSVGSSTGGSASTSSAAGSSGDSWTGALTNDGSTGTLTGNDGPTGASSTADMPVAPTGSSTGSDLLSSTGYSSPTVIDPPAVITFVLDVDVSTLDSEWVASFLALVRSYLNIRSSRIQLKSLSAGSAIVEIEITSANPGEATAQSQASLFVAGMQEPTSSLRTSPALATYDASRPATYQIESACPDGSYTSPCPTDNSPSSTLPYILGGIFATLILILIGIIAFWIRRRRRLAYQKQMHGLEETVEQNPAISVLPNTQLRSDADLQMTEV